MIRACPDGPGGGPDDLEARLVEAQGRMSGWVSGWSGQGLDDPGRGPDDPALGGGFCSLRSI